MSMRQATPRRRKTMDVALLTDRDIPPPRIRIRLPCRQMRFDYEYRKENGRWGARVWRMPDDWPGRELKIGGDQPCSP